MAKKKVKKEADKDESVNEGVNEILIKNFVSLQKVMTNLGEKFDSLSVQISKLLELFEGSAKILAEKEMVVEKNRDNREDYREMIEKIKGLYEQNKIIARGLTLLYEQQPKLGGYEISSQPLPQSLPLKQSVQKETQQIQNQISQTQERGKEKFRREIT